MAHSFIESDKVVIHVISMVSFLWLWLSLVFSDCDFHSVCHLMDEDKVQASWWEGLAVGETGLALVGMVILSSVQFSRSVVSDSLWPHGLQHFRLPCPSLSPRACSNSCPLSRLCHPTIWSSVVPFSCFLSYPGSFPMSWLFTSGGQSIEASTSVLSVNIQDWFPLGWTGWISLLSKGLSRVFSNTTVQKHSSLALSLLYVPTLTSIHDY